MSTCSGCDGQFAPVERGRPRRYCLECRLRRRQLNGPTPLHVAQCERGRHAAPGPHLPDKSMQCAGCAKWIWRSATSRGPGLSRCLDCIRQAPKARIARRGRGLPPRKNICPECGIPCYGIRCRSCRDLSQRIRPGDDPRTTRREREQSAPGLTSTQRKRLLARCKARNAPCAYCHQRAATTLDHVIPLVLGGTNFEGNLAPSCKCCNSSKGARLTMEWRVRNGRTRPGTEISRSAQAA